MVDYSIDGSFDIHFTEWDDFVTVDGLAEFEQDVVIQLHENLEVAQSHRGSQKTAKDKIRLQVSRVAKQFGVIDAIKNISVEKIRGTAGSYAVEVTYQTGDTFRDEI